MAIKDILRMYGGTNSATTEDGRMLALSLAEIQTELLALRESLGKSAPVPTEVVTTIDTSALEKAISQLRPLPPQNLDLNPVYRSYEETAKVIKELLGEVKTTNHRLMGMGGGGGPSVIQITDQQGNRLRINTDGSLNISPNIDGGDAYSTGELVDGGGA